MIDPYTWRRDIGKLAARLSKRIGAKRVAATSSASLEKDLMVALYMAHKLLEDHRIGDQFEHGVVPVRTYDSAGRTANLSNPDAVRRAIMRSEGEDARLKFPVLVNKIIHSYLIQTLQSPEEGLQDILVCSEFEHSRKLYRVGLAEITKQLVGIAAGGHW